MFLFWGGLTSLGIETHSRHLLYNDINANSNFWGTQDIEVAKRKIFDERVDDNGNKTTFKINIDPIALQLYDDAKPR